MNPPSSEDSITLRFLNGPRAGEVTVLRLPASLGRASTNTIVISRPDLGASHGHFTAVDGVISFTDGGSPNGSMHRRNDAYTPLGGREKAAELWDGDVLELGDPANPLKVSVELSSAPIEGVIASRSVDAVDQLMTRVTSESSQLGVLFTYASKLTGAKDMDSVFQWVDR